MDKLAFVAATLLFAPFAVPVPAAVAVASSANAGVEELLAADRQWSQAAAGADLVSGICAMFDAAVVLPLPGGDFARTREEAAAALAANPANKGARASWSPVRAGVSGDGRHGFSFGYMTLQAADKSVRHAKYLAYWVKRPDGWRVAAYKRVPSPQAGGTPPMAPLVPRPLPAHPDQAALKASLIAAEQGFSDEAQRVGLHRAFESNGRADAMNMGREAAFVIGAEAIGASMPADPVSPVHWSAEDALVAGSGDLGVTWGKIRPHKVEEGQPAEIPFFTIWYRPDPSQPWKYVAE
jgi:ketosteroid isomerase-like protein